MSRAVKRIRQLLTLGRVVVLLWYYRLALWLLPFRRVTRWAEHATAHSRAHSTVLPEASTREQRRVARKVERASAFVPHATCLVRVLAAAHLFAVQGKRSQIVIGVRRRTGGIEAHAWLESGGQVVVGDIQDLASYYPLS